MGKTCELRAPNWNSRWVVMRAAFMSFCGTTNEILHSEEPCAIAIIFTFSRPTAPSGRRCGDSATQHIWHSDDPRTTDGDQCDIADRGERLHSPVIRGAGWSNFRSWPFGRERVADPKRDAALHHRTHRFRMKDLGTEVGELRRFTV